MKLIKAHYVIETPINAVEIMKTIERVGRSAYKSEAFITEESAEKFVLFIIRSLGHLSVIEHVSLTVRVICDRGVTHEIVRHRLASYTQESTRYCNYSKEKFGSEIAVIDIAPHFKNASSFDIWFEQMLSAEKAYFKLLANGETAQIARSVLPNSLKTEILITMNLREWRHFFELRTAEAAHPQMREVAVPLLAELKNVLPAIFGDIHLESE